MCDSETGAARGSGRTGWMMQMPWARTTTSATLLPWVSIAERQPRVLGVSGGSIVCCQRRDDAGDGASLDISCWRKDHWRPASRRRRYRRGLAGQRWVTRSGLRAAVVAVVSGRLGTDRTCSRRVAAPAPALEPETGHCCSLAVTSGRCRCIFSSSLRGPSKTAIDPWRRGCARLAVAPSRNKRVLLLAVRFVLGPSMRFVFGLSFRVLRIGEAVLRVVVGGAGE